MTRTPFLVFSVGLLLATSTPVISDGKSDYDAKCSACHGFGVAGAPKVGDPAAWVDRIAAGQDMLYKNAIDGFTGSTGMMPAKGGFVDLTDEQIKEIVDYMVEQSQ